jgi:RNA polymerase sigma-70 factor (ECF subfamily)
MCARNWRLRRLNGAVRRLSVNGGEYWATDGRCACGLVGSALLVTRPEFEHLALSHLEAMHRMAFTLTRNPDAAADLVQEAYLLAFRAWESFSQREEITTRDGESAASASMRAWLFRILHNAHYTAGRKAKRAPVLSEAVDSTADTHGAPGDAPPAWNLRDLDWEHVDDRLKIAIDALSGEHREVLLLWGVEGMKYREIAEILGVPLGTIMSRLHRARKAVADALSSSTADADDDLAVRVRHAAALMTNHD